MRAVQSPGGPLSIRTSGATSGSAPLQYRCAIARVDGRNGASVRNLDRPFSREKSNKQRLACGSTGSTISMTVPGDCSQDRRAMASSGHAKQQRRRGERRAKSVVCPSSRASSDARRQGAKARRVARRSAAGVTVEPRAPMAGSQPKAERVRPRRNSVKARRTGD